MVASLVLAKIDLAWADNQYWCTLFEVIREINKAITPKEKKKLTANDMAKFVED